MQSHSGSVRPLLLSSQPPKTSEILHCTRLDTRGDTKFDEPMCVSIGTVSSMFSPVADMMRWTDTVHPAPSYPHHYEKWKLGLQDSIDAILKDSDAALSTEEEYSMDTATGIGASIFERFLKHATAVGWASQTKEERQQAVEAILSLPQIPQRTQAWYAQGKSVLTASEFATIYGTERAVRQLAQQKIQPPATSTNRLACLTHEMGPFDWGIRFEPVVKTILEERWGAKILDAGRLLHPTDPLLAASPDGLIHDAADDRRVGRLLEIKCPVTREITGAIPFEYWSQMQIQMEVTGVDECEYVEVKLDSITAKKADLSGASPEGYVWLLQNPTTCEMSYAYTEEQKALGQAAGLDVVEAIPWRLAKIFTKIVSRDRAWFQGTAPMRQHFWETVEKLRNGEIVPLEPKQRLKVIVAKEGACLITEEGDAPEAS